MRQKQADAPPDTRKQQLMEDLRRTKCALDQAYHSQEFTSTEWFGTSMSAHRILGL